MAASATREVRRRRKRKPGTLADLQAALWYAVERVRDELENDAYPLDQRLKCVHALSQVSGTYLNTIKVGEHEERLAALEAAAEGSTT